LTPRITLIEDAPDDLQRESGLAHLSRQEIVHDVASRKGTARSALAGTDGLVAAD